MKNKNNIKIVNKTKIKNIRNTKFFIYIVLALFLSFGSVGSIIYAQNYFKNAPVEKVTDAYILTKISKITDIPNEDPIYIAKVKDEQTLSQDMSMFSYAKTGDYIVVFKKKAYIYDLINNNLVKIIDWDTR